MDYVRYYYILLEFMAFPKPDIYCTLAGCDKFHKLYVNTDCTGIYSKLSLEMCPRLIKMTKQTSFDCHLFALLSGMDKPR